MADPMAMKLQYGWYAYMMIYEMEYFYVSIEGWIGCFWAREVLVTDFYLTDTKYHYNEVVKLRVIGLCKRNPSVTGGILSQKASNAENVSIWWHRHGFHQINPFVNR